MLSKQYISQTMQKRPFKSNQKKQQKTEQVQYQNCICSVNLVIHNSISYCDSYCICLFSDICIHEEPVSIRRMPGTCDLIALQPEVIVISHRNTSCFFH